MVRYIPPIEEKEKGECKPDETKAKPPTQYVTVKAAYIVVRANTKDDDRTESEKQKE
jgi:hypothetical protein